MIETQLPHMTYLGDGISTDEDFEEDAESDATPVVAPPSEDEAPESDAPLGSPDEV